VVVVGCGGHVGLPLTDETLHPVEEVLERSDILVIGAPHTCYRTLQLPSTPLVDVWGITPAGIVV